MEHEEGEDFVLVGAFSPREIKRVTHHLEAIDVEYEVEFDDSEITEMSPAAVVHGMHSAVTVKLYVDPEKMLEVEAVIETLYPP